MTIVMVSYAASPERITKRVLRPLNLRVHASRMQQAKATKSANDGEHGRPSSRHEGFSMEKDQRTAAVDLHGQHLLIIHAASVRRRQRVNTYCGQAAQRPDTL
jgi:hypothetical protein